MNRDLPALRLQRSPLVFVVMQVKISPIFSLLDYLPKLQEVFRKSGYPRFQRGMMQQINFGPDFVPKVESNWRLEFYNTHKTTAVLFAPESVTLQTNSYTTFEDFEQSFRAALDVLNKTVEISVVEGVGLRYVDWLRPEPGETAESLLKPGLRGLDPHEIGLSDSIHLSHLVGKTNLGQMLVRFYQQKGQYLPIDIGPIGLSYQRPIGPTEVASLLDFDHQAGQSFEFSVEEVSDVAWRLHDPLDRAFRASVTSEAMQLWGAQNV